ncbi:unnamed protein product, partial [Cylicostephanus goldi]
MPITTTEQVLIRKSFLRQVDIIYSRTLYLPGPPALHTTELYENFQHSKMRTCILLLSCLHLCYGYKFLVYSPIYGYSHTNFMGAIADTLTEAGHDV